MLQMPHADDLKIFRFVVRGLNFLPKRLKYSVSMWCHENGLNLNVYYITNIRNQML